LRNVTSAWVIIKMEKYRVDVERAHCSL
jgi:hypothetical protein